ncbi:MAG: ferredoxin family protein [Candidatus Latescibacterota bacterium]|nr:MAG: ferredoxin family protein [Candidatus Latescibacterota bacterium]
MTHVVFSPCIGTKDTACVQVCPVDCFFDVGEMLIISPEECIDCGACVDECPVDAILPEEDVVGTPEAPFVEKNRVWFEERSTEEIEAARMLAG